MGAHMLHNKSNSKYTGASVSWGKLKEKRTLISAVAKTGMFLAIFVADIM